MNLFKMAATNSPALEPRLRRVTSSLSTAEAGTVDRLIEGVREHGSVGINMRQTGLMAFLTINEYQNVYEWAQSIYSVSHEPVDDILRRKLNAFYERRLFFDNSFDHGKEFRYGSLMTTGVGPTNYGDHCTILKAKAIANIEVTFLMRDSLTTYVLPGPALDKSAIEADVALDASKHFLAGIKLHREVLVMPEPSWGSLLSSDDDYIEAIFKGTLTANDIEEVRMSKSDYDLYHYFAYQGFREKLDTATRAFIESFAFIVKLLSTKGIRLEVV